MNEIADEQAVEFGKQIVYGKGNRTSKMFGYPIAPDEAIPSNQDIEFLKHVAKFYINGSIPVYRRYIEEANVWRYSIFEDTDNVVVTVNGHGQSIAEHVKMITDAISNTIEGAKSIKRAI